MLHISIRYKGEADLQERINASFTLRKMIKFIKSKYDVRLERVGDIMCDFCVDLKGGESSRKTLEEELQSLLSKDGYEISITEEEADSSNTSTLSEDPPAKQNGPSEHSKQTGNGSESSKEDAARDAKKETDAAAGEDKEDNGKEKEVARIMGEIDSLIGAESFKRKAEELCLVAPKLKKIKGYFSGCKFLFSIDDGSGLSTMVNLLGQLLYTLELIPKSKVAELPPLPYVDTPDAMDNLKARYLQFMDSYRHAGILVLDITKAYQSLEKAIYREFLSDVCAHEDMPIVVFRIPYVEDQVRRSVENCLSDQFFLHSVSVVPSSMDELYAYAEKIASGVGYKLDAGVRPLFCELLAKEKSDGRFYGFQTVSKLVNSRIYEKAKSNSADGELITADECDCDRPEPSYLQDLSGEEQLHRLYGLESVVKQIEEVVSFIEFARNDPKLNPSFHMRFLGNPGTGKTTVARILGKILKEKGILRTGVFFEYSGNDFIGQYVGHTAPKTAQMCRDAYGGILFIDEAYALSPNKSAPGNHGSFKQDALNTLLTEMENHRQDMLVIMAGYEDEIDDLMQQNPGLKERIPYTIRFENYSKEALANIFLSMVSKEFLYEEEFVDAVKNYFDAIPNNIYYNESFSNARYVRNLYERTVSKAVLRAQMEKTKVATLATDDFLKAVEELQSMAVVSSRRNNGAGGAAMFNEERAKINFSDVCGQEEAKESLAEIVDYLKYPAKYRAIGAKVPKGALLYGPPGTGKTMLAKAVAGEAGVPVLTISGSDLIATYQGEGAERVRELFEKARKIAPSIVFIDEIDSIGISRSQGNNSSALMQLLTEMDGFEDDKTVIVLAATNRPQELDPALRRPGRFDREIPVELPDLEGRIAILAHYVAKTSHESDIDLKAVGNMTTGFSGAQLCNIVNEAAHRALRMERDKITTEDLLESVEVVMVGYVKKNSILSDHEKRVVCYHEIGHALVTALQTGTTPVQKITIVPRTGGTLGYVMHSNSEQKNLSTKTEMENRIAVCVGGRAAEEIRFGEITTGASNDIVQATSIARAIVATYGMTDEFDMVCFDKNTGGYLGGGRQQNCSEATARRIDEKVVEIVKQQHQKALELLRANKHLLDALADYIYEKESITGEEFKAILRKNGIVLA